MSLSTVVATSARLLAALAHAHSGDTILLAPGNYSTIQINKIYAPTGPGMAGISITSEFSDQRATLGSVTIASSSGIAISNVKVSTIGLPMVLGNGDGTDSG